ncbi:unnamed protein product [Lactuca saligna]|uniref:Uncharacterized protein n=1 Tax=Lactuca saligna TaxID=75948 RepID=A0AA35V0L0_LACSI|nr:unnamed protein product [Lactuca saligna]
MCVSRLYSSVMRKKQESIEKDLLIGNLDVKVFEIEKENSQKNKHISDLQANLGGLTALYFDLRDKLIGKFGDEFITSSFDCGKASESSERVVVSPAPDANIDEFLSSGPITVEERREKKKKIDKLKKDKILLMKNSDRNTPSDQPQMFIKEIGKRKFSDRYGDRSGIRMWGYEADKKMRIVKRKSGKLSTMRRRLTLCLGQKLILQSWSTHRSTIQQMIPTYGHLKSSLKTKIR